MSKSIENSNIANWKTVGELNSSPNWEVVPKLETGYAEINDIINAQSQKLLNRTEFLYANQGINANLFNSLESAIDAAAQSKLPLLLKGEYSYNTAPNFARQDLTVVAIGKVTLRHTGTGRALLIDAGTNTNIYNVRILGDIVVKGNSNTDAEGAVFIRGVHHSEINLRAHDIPGRAFDVSFGVLTEYNLTCSVNRESFAITPTSGVRMRSRNVGEYIACSSGKLIFEGIPGVGVDLVDVDGCRFSGTSEGNGIGIRDTASCKDNTFEEFWCEGNTTRDVELYGQRTRFINCKSISPTTGAGIELVTATGTAFHGGFIRHINIQGGSTGTTFEGTALSNHPSLGITSGSNYTSNNCYLVDIDGNKTADFKNKLGNSGPFVPSLVAASGGSTHTYTRRDGFYRITAGMASFNIWINISSKDASMSGGVSITGLPVSSDADGGYSVVSVVFGGITQQGGREVVVGYIPPGTNYIVLNQCGAGGAAESLLASSVSDNAYIMLSGSYPV